MKSMRELLAIAIVIGMASAGAAGCDSTPRHNLSVDAWLTMCVNNGGMCYRVGLPQATVTLKLGSRLVAQGATDQNGVASFTLSRTYTSILVTVISPLLAGGSRQTATAVSTESTSVSIFGEMSSDVRPE